MTKEELMQTIKENGRLRDIFQEKLQFHLGYRFRFESEIYELIEQRIEITQNEKDTFDINDGTELIVRLFKPERIGKNGEQYIGEYHAIPSVNMPRILRG